MILWPFFYRESAFLADRCYFSSFAKSLHDSANAGQNASDSFSQRNALPRNEEEHSARKMHARETGKSNSPEKCASAKRGRALCQKNARPRNGEEQFAGKMHVRETGKSTSPEKCTSAKRGRALCQKNVLPRNGKAESTNRGLLQNLDCHQTMTKTSAGQENMALPQVLVLQALDIRKICRIFAAQKRLQTWQTTT